MKLNLDKSVKVKIDPTMRDHSNDPFVKRKIEESKKIISKAGLPPEYLKMQAELMKK